MIPSLRVIEIIAAFHRISIIPNSLKFASKIKFHSFLDISIFVVVKEFEISYDLSVALYTATYPTGATHYVAVHIIFSSII